jgi:hypothetical protein
MARRRMVNQQFARRRMVNQQFAISKIVWRPFNTLDKSEATGRNVPSTSIRAFAWVDV